MNPNNTYEVTSQNFDATYKDIFKYIMKYGVAHKGTTAVFNVSWSFQGWMTPVLGLRKVYLGTLVKELNWILRGEYNVQALGKQAHIWAPWADKNGNLQSSYGRYLRSFPTNFTPSPGEACQDTLDKSPRGLGGIDQMQKLLEGLLEETPSRRLQASLMHPESHYSSNLPPCMSGLGLNWFATERDGRKLIANIKFRSSDFGIGFVFDILQWYLVVQMLIQEANKSLPFSEQYSLASYTFSADCMHVYDQHLYSLREMVTRLNTPAIEWHGYYLTLPENSLDMTEDIQLNIPHYHPYDSIKLPLIV